MNQIIHIIFFNNAFTIIFFLYLYTTATKNCIMEYVYCDCYYLAGRGDCYYLEGELIVIILLGELIVFILLGELIVIILRES